MKDRDEAMQIVQAIRAKRAPKVEVETEPAFEDEFPLDGIDPIEALPEEPEAPSRVASILRNLRNKRAQIDPQRAGKAS